MKQSAMSGKLIARYTRSGNTVIQPTALDLTTGIFTISGGGITAAIGANGAVSNNDIIIATSVFANGILPREIQAAGQIYYRLQAISDTTFYLQSSSNNSTYANVTSYPNANNTLVDVTKFWFEINNPAISVDISSFNLSEVLIRGYGFRSRGSQSYNTLIGTYGSGSTFQFLTPPAMDGSVTMYQFGEWYHGYDPTTQTITSQIIRWCYTRWNESAGTWFNSASTGIGNTFYRPYPNLKMTSIQTQHLVANGYTFEIYDPRG